MNGKSFPQGFKLKKMCTLEKPLDLKRLKHDLSNSFGYLPAFDIGIDFFPLFTKKTLSDSFFLEHKNEVVGSIFVKEKTLQIKSSIFTCLCMGGIFIKKEHRGKGIFRTFFEKVIKELSDHQNPDFFILWSEQEELYKKFNFFPAGNTYYKQETTQGKTPEWEVSNLNSLSNNDFNQIKNLWKNKVFKNSFFRTDSDWDELKKITSCSIYLKRGKEGLIESYFLMSKGMDLNGIVHEFTDDEQTLSIIKNLSLISNAFIQEGSILIPSCLARANKTNSLESLKNIYCFGLDCI